MHISDIFKYRYDKLVRCRKIGANLFLYQFLRKATPKTARLITIAHISHASKEMLKIIYDRLFATTKRQVPKEQACFVKKAEVQENKSLIKEK